MRITPVHLLAAYTLTSMLALPASADPVVGGAHFFAGGIPSGWANFKLFGPDFRIRGAGFSCGSVPYELDPGNFSIDPMLGSGCGPEPPQVPFAGTATVDGVHYGGVAFYGYIQTSTSGFISESAYEQGGSVAAPGTLTVYLQGCPFADVLFNGTCSIAYPFTLQFTVAGLNITSWYSNGIHPEVNFRTAPEPASVALVALGVLAFGIKKRARSAHSKSKSSQT